MKRATFLLLALALLWGCEPEPLPIVSCPCDCAGPDLDCADFVTQAEAQACFDCCRQQGYGDIFRLDADNDGVACEALLGYLEVGGGLELLVLGMPYKALQEEFGEPESYSEVWEEGPLGTSSEVTWGASFVVKEFDHWEIWASGTESEGLKTAGGRWADRREFDGWTIEYWTPPPGQPLGPGPVADPLRQLGMLMQPEEVTERLGVAARTGMLNGRARDMRFQFLNVCWELDVRYGEHQVQDTGNDEIDYEYGVTGWYLSWEPCR